MRIFQAFLIIVTAAILFMLPISEAIYDFRTDLREDTFGVTTGVGETSANVVLVKQIYDDDVITLSLSSNLTTDNPAYSSYDNGTRALAISGFTSNATRSLIVGYDVAAFTSTSAIDAFLGRLPYIWMVCVICLAPAALIAIFTGRG